jgi:hypothetical protein
VNVDVSTTEADDRERELRDLWLSRVMFNPFVRWPAETRTFEEFVAAHDALEVTTCKNSLPRSAR